MLESIKRREEELEGRKKGRKRQLKNCYLSLVFKFKVRHLHSTIQNKSAMKAKKRDIFRLALSISIFFKSI
jgi:hypothetical protein